MVSPAYNDEVQIDSATIRALKFSDSLSLSLVRCSKLDGRALSTLITTQLTTAISPLERALCYIALAHVDDVTSAIKAVQDFAEERINAAVTSAVKAACEHLKHAESVTLLSGSTLATRTVESLSLQSVSCLDSGTGSFPECATRVGSLDSAPELLENSAALVLGAHEIAMNGAVVCSAGSGVTAALARDAGIPVVVIAQSAKFSESTLLSPVLGDHDVLKPSEVDVIVTEKGIVSAHMAPDISKENRLTKE